MVDEDVSGAPDNVASAQVDHVDRQSEMEPDMRITAIPVDYRLSKVLGRDVAPEEIAIWTDMPPARRAKALQRIAALDRYCGGEEGLTAKQAAADAGVKLGRFYQMARAWPEARSLRSLGTYAVATQSRERFKPDIVNALQAVVAEVVRDNAIPPASVAKLAQLLGDRSGLPADDLPKKNTLRLYVEREIRRVREARQAGQEILFDCSASSLRRKDGDRHTVFMIIDRGTRLILGRSVGSPAESASGYAAAARDAQRRIGSGSFPGRLWSPQLVNVQLVPGTDMDGVRELMQQVYGETGGSTPQVVGQGTYGRYIREHVGLKLGPIQLLPGRTGDALGTEGSDALGLDDADALARLDVPIADHNATVLADLSVDGESLPPGELVRLLEPMARG
ncbi:hypothetical protein [Sphingomonas albertensis]|uniref:Uncharacterized protein n=1 Tax=Sphingomonas albertensis TaxID=2762591 RepID=A0ABR7AJN7_9SPHN|nr:hypothetical protein [Sphingomonas albertensis]MBC3940611.1 hypothetical protein [Sphingomonas albertensis]